MKFVCGEVDGLQTEVAYEVCLWGSGWIIDREKRHMKFACMEVDGLQTEKWHMKFVCGEVDGFQTEVAYEVCLWGSGWIIDRNGI